MKAKLKEWADAVKARDGRCMACGSVEDLHAHHIKPKATHPDLIFDVGNGKTLCYRCHKAEHAACRVVRTGPVGPSKKTLQRQVDALEARVRELESEVRRMRQKVGECERGVCRPALRRLVA